MDAMVLPERPFLGCRVVGDLTRLDADVVVLGIPHAVPYVVDEEQRGLAAAPAAVRNASQQFAGDLTHHDFDLGHAFLREGGPRLVDVGDVPFAFGAVAENVRRADEGLAQIVRQGVMPLVCDGLDPSVAPGTGWPQPGGLTFRHVAAVIAELARTSRIVGADVVELLPSRDVNGLTALTAARLLMLLADSRSQAPSDAS